MATTRRDFEAIAKIVNGVWDKAGPKGEPIVIDVAEQLADYFESQNQRFDRELFMVTCGIETY